MEGWSEETEDYDIDEAIALMEELERRLIARNNEIAALKQQIKELQKQMLPKQWQLLKGDDTDE